MDGHEKAQKAQKAQKEIFLRLFAPLCGQFSSQFVVQVADSSVCVAAARIALGIPGRPNWGSQCSSPGRAKPDVANMSSVPKKTRLNANEMRQVFITLFL